MKRFVSMLFAVLMLISLTACALDDGGTAPSDAAPAARAKAPSGLHAGGEFCTEEDILAVHDDAKAAGYLETAQYLVVHQGDIPTDVRPCIDSILAGSDFAALDGTEYSNSIDARSSI